MRATSATRPFGFMAGASSGVCNAPAPQRGVPLARQIYFFQIAELAVAAVEHCLEHEHPELFRLAERRPRRQQQLLTRTDDIDKRGAIVPKHFSDRITNFLRRLDANALDAHCLSHLSEV